MSDCGVRRILVGYDGSDGGRRALDRAIAEARESRGRITVLSVERVPLDPNVPRNFGTVDDISAWEGAALSPPADVVAHLREANDRLRAAGLEAELTWAAGEPGQVIVETARRIQADVIVLGEHRHGRFASFFGADIDAEVQNEAGCDVLLA
jgi:nucleotide-binding universal stress UspA family protein